MEKISCQDCFFSWFDGMIFGYTPYIFIDIYMYFYIYIYNMYIYIDM